MRLLGTFMIMLSLITTVLSGNNDEFRAVWVITWEHINRFETADQNKARVRQILDNVKRSNMNTVLWQARQSGTAYYNSSYEPWGFYAGHADPGYDPLAYAIEEAHKRGLELHAWFNVFQVSEDDATLDPLPPAVAHPNWICRDISGNPMPSRLSFSAGLDSVRRYTVDVAMEIVNNYDVDGLHLDYVRYNEYTTSNISAKTGLTEKEKYQPDGIISGEPFDLILADTTSRYLWDTEHPDNGGIPDGFSNWADFWRWSVTEFVKTLHDSIQVVKPWVRLSPAALGKYNWSGWSGYDIVYQDAALWYNQGYIDQMTPMHYHWLTPEGFYDMLTGNCPECWSQWIQPGINDGQLYTVGPRSFLFDSEISAGMDLLDDILRTHPAVVNRCRQVSWTDGFQFFSYGQWASVDYFDEAKITMFPTVKKVRDTQIIDQSIPETPTVEVTKIDSLEYEITVTPPAGITSDHWYVIYRSLDEIIDQDNDQIIHRAFGQNSFTHNDTFNDIQEYTEVYYYAATTLDRYWNESVTSNVVPTDTIPEITPEVPPMTPDHIRILNYSANSLKVLCDPAERATEYVALISMDGETFTDSVTADTNEIIVDGLQEDMVYYIKVKAKNAGGSSRLTRKLYAGVPSSNPHEVLIVNGFDRSTNTRHDYIRFYADPVNDRGYPFSYVMNETVEDGKISLNGFSTVIWILGDESTADATFTVTEQEKVESFLDSGGQLFVSGAEIGWDLEENGTITDTRFYRNYLKARYIDDAPQGENETFYTARELSGAMFEGLGDINFDNGSQGTIDVDWPDAILAAGEGANVLMYKYVSPVETYGGAGIAYDGLFPEASVPGKLVHFAFPFETIYPASKRIDVMDRIFDLFEGLIVPSPIVMEDMQKPEAFKLYQNYPNPFNPETQIKFSLIESNFTTLSVYDILGQKVVTLVEEELTSGSYTAKFNAQDLASGTYFYILQSGSFMMKKKMVLIK